MSIPSRSFAALSLAAFIGPSARAYFDDGHYSRTPAVVAADTQAGQFAVASDSELSVILYLDANGSVAATRSDGRGLDGTWSAPAILAAPPAGREIHRDSIHVLGDRAFALWLEDEGSSAKTRIRFSRFENSAWTPAVKVSDAGVPTGDDIVGFAAVVKPGLSGNAQVSIVFHTTNALGTLARAYGVVSTSAGASFGLPFALSATGAAPGGVATRVGGVSVDAQLGELHVAWTDNRNATGADLRDVYYRRAIVDFFGNVIFAPPLGTGSELLIDGATSADGAPIVTVNGEYKWTGSNQKYVGIAWRDLDKGLSDATLKVRVSHDSGTTFLLPNVVAHTGNPGVGVGSFDFETVGDTFTITWDDNARDDGQGGITIPAPAETQVWHCESSDGSDFDPSQTAVLQMASAFEDAAHVGSSPRIARSVGNPDGSMIVFLEGDGTTAEVYTTFSDQEFGGSWHIDEYPVASTAQGDGGGIDVIAPDVAYNRRYYNFVVVWQQESLPGNGSYDLVVGGYRPQAAEIEGWYVGSTSVNWVLDHAPFQDTFAFFLISGAANNALGGNVLLPDGRKTGLLPDALYTLGLTNFVLFAAPIDPLIEGASTLPIPIPSNLLFEGFSISFVGVTWGPFGEIHTVTDWVTATVEPAPGS